MFRVRAEARGVNELALAAVMRLHAVVAARTHATDAEAMYELGGFLIGVAFCLEAPELALDVREILVAAAGAAARGAGEEPQSAKLLEQARFIARGGRLEL